MKLKIIISTLMISLSGVVQACPLACSKHSIEFSPVKVPETDAEKSSILASESVKINDEIHQIGFHTILRSGDKLGDKIFGQLVDFEGNPILSEDGTSRISNNAEFSSLLTIGNKLFMVSHFETRPGAMYITELSQDLKTGLLTAVNTKPADFSKVKGGWVHCAGSVTPWNTHLGSEEYEPNAELHDPITGSLDSYYENMATYYGGNLFKLNPYYYGYNIEFKILNEAGDYEITKHYAMGRLAFELSYVLPDQKTVYSSDDGTNVGFYMFVADREMDLSSGTLYGAVWNQTSTENGGSAKLEWINLGHATDSEIKQYIDQGISFADIFYKVAPIKEGVCPDDYTSINAGHRADKYGHFHQCLKIKPGMEKAASRLETRRYAAIKGVTTEFRKEEGITFNPVTNTVYVAMSEISYGMEDNQKYGKANTKYDIGGNNKIKLPYNRCGGIYALDLSRDESIGSNFVAKNMYGVVMGKMTQAYDKKSPIAAYQEPFSKNKCDLNGIANPDNLSFIQGYDTLIIAEDTGSGHENDMIWSYDLKMKKLTRIQTTPYGSETTSPYVYKNINGFGYLMSVVQHPYAGIYQNKLNDAKQASAYVGYIGPFPALK
jgi:secreted PhoX family phosphatase